MERNIKIMTKLVYKKPLIEKCRAGAGSHFFAPTGDTRYLKCYKCKAIKLTNDKPTDNKKI
jgi:hypothetical protein